MNTSNYQQPVLSHSITVALALWVAAIASPVQAQQSDALAAQESWQNNRLFKPTAHQRKQEKGGRVMIYDGLKDTTVNEAMDKAFDRIQNMMFIRVIRTKKNGQPLHGKNGHVLVEDDDC